MTKKWDLYKDEIEHLYIARGLTLDVVREKIRREYGFDASIRAWKMKLDEWKFGKNTSRNKKKEQRRKSPVQPFTLPDESPSSEIHSQISNNESLPTLSTSMEKRLVRSVLLSPSYLAVNIPGDGSFHSMTGHSLHYTLHYTLHSLLPSKKNLFGENPLINSSLMFFSDRRPIDSLELLSRSPNLASQALEIVLRNWKPGLDHLLYLCRFLQNKIYCQTIFGVNWTRWSHSDETLFDLVDENVPEEDKNFVRKALLRADYKFKPPLQKLKAPWAETWRLAIREQTWDLRKHLLLKLDVRNQLLRCAMAVVAEELMKYHNGCLRRLEMTDPEMKDPGYIHSLQQKDRILKDCRCWAIEIDLPSCSGWT